MNWNEFSWACFLFHIWNRNDAYIQLMNNGAFVGQVWAIPPDMANANVGEIAASLIAFLSGYGCHTPNTDNVRNGLSNALNESAPYLQALSNHTIDNFNINLAVNIHEEANPMPVQCVIRRLYRTFLGVPNIGATSTGKLLHVLQPRLFVMWDGGIREHCEVAENMDGYCTFLGLMQGLAQEVNEAFQLAHPNNQEGPSAYLSQTLQIHPPKTLAKYIDEYNWVRFARNINDPPPAWFPY